MGLFSKFFGKNNHESDDMDCDWFCDNCNAYLNGQSGFSTSNGEWICTECGYVNDVTENNIIFDSDDGDDDYSDEENIPEGCNACGGPYPLCKESCPLFDDD